MNDASILLHDTPDEIQSFIQEWTKRSKTARENMLRRWRNPEALPVVLAASIRNLDKCRETGKQYREDNPEDVERLWKNGLYWANEWQVKHPEEAATIGRQNLERHAREPWKQWRSSGKSEAIYKMLGESLSEWTKHHPECHWITNNPEAHLITLQTQGPRRNCASGYKGVSWKTPMKGKGRSGWIACILNKGKRRESRVFTHKEQAAVAYDRLAIHLYTDVAYLNFPLFSSLHYEWYGHDSLER